MVADDANANHGDQTDHQETRAVFTSQQCWPCQLHCAPSKKNGLTEARHLA